MGFPVEPPRRQPYNRPDASPPAQGQHWFDASPNNRAAEPPQEASRPTGPRERPTEPSGERPRREMWSPYDEGPRSRRPIFIAAGAFAALVAAGIGLAVLANSDPDPVPGATSPTAEAPLIPPADTAEGKFGFATSRAGDPHLLTLNEVFKRKKVKIGGQTYLMTTRRTDKKCDKAVVGEKLQKALTAAKCNQLLRASFRDASGKIIGTVGVANLKTSAGASKVVSVGSGKEREEYLKPLPGKDKVTKLLGTGEAFVGEWRHGHYAVMVWFQYKDGHLPKKTEVKKLNQAAFGAADATVTPALEARSLTGKRP
ncbi:hypothetical protein AB0F88_07400 [Streptosporangium sp. NPDC023963]|uniref:hypothetical protein n=1 Tax=Streptosporangium sp. NPDC023963 TaxID=3155608 RepID=UPI003418F3B5